MLILCGSGFHVKEILGRRQRITSRLRQNKLGAQGMSEVLSNFPLLATCIAPPFKQKYRGGRGGGGYLKYRDFRALVWAPKTGL